MENKKNKYMLFMYKESEHWISDYERSEYYTVFSDKIEEFTDTLYTYGWFNNNFRSDWDITTIVKGVVVDKNSFRGIMEQKDRQAEKRREQYRLAGIERDRVRLEIAVREQEEADKRNWERLKAKFGSGQ